MEMQIRKEGKLILNAPVVLRYFITDKSEIEKVLLAGSGDGNKMATSDLALYEALGSVLEDDRFNWRKVVKFLENVQIVSHENVTGTRKKILTPNRVEEIRKEALR